MYAKSIMEYVCARAKSGGWSQHLIFAPVAMALVVAVLPFTLEPHFAIAVQPSAPRSESVAADNPFSGLVQANNVATPSKRSALPIDKQERAIVGYITRKYGVSVEVVQELVRTAFAAGKQFGVDPRLVVAMMAVESSFNPIAESFAGAKGLMQIIPKYHQEKFAEFGGEQAVFDPRVNILVGARIMREYLLMTSGDLITALQTYAGAIADRGALYTHRVLNEKDQLDELAGLPKTNRSGTVVMPLDPPRPGTLVVPVASIQLPPAPQAAQPAEAAPAPVAPAASAAMPVLSTTPATKALEDAKHTPPTQLQPPQQQQPAAAPVNVTLLLPESTLR